MRISRLTLPRGCALFVAMAWSCLSGLPARAAMQFDVFLGYDDLIREANWFPIACEIHHDGPSFSGVVEVSSDQLGRGQVRRVALELPTNTRKRFVIPVFGSGGRYGSWSVRLLDSRGKVRAEHTNLRPRREVTWQAHVLGALPRTFGGMPRMPETTQGQGEFAPEVARLQADYLPDNAIALEGLSALYLHAEKALDLSVGQANALVSWVAGGGHLIVAVEQPTEVNSTPWLRSLLPADLTGILTVNDFGPLERYAAKLSEYVAKAPRVQPRSSSGKSPPRKQSSSPTAQTVIEDLNSGPVIPTEMPVVTCTVRDGKLLLSSLGTPLIVEAVRGRGKVTLLTFSPEREPFRSWKNKGWFWAQIAEVPQIAFTAGNIPRYSYQSLDGVFGALIDSTQVRKLPVSWLLLLLIVYLLVIGPVDHYSLKKINKQMLTWITFPCYVVGFSLLIYWIGFLLRAGETEWNELHVVDVIPRGQKADLRGRTFGSVYSPANARYRFGMKAEEGSRKFSTLRGEFLGSFGGGQESSQGNINQQGDGFEAEMAVPVWTSQLFVGDWLQPGEAPLSFTARHTGSGYEVTIENRLPRTLTDLRLVAGERIYKLDSVESGKSVKESLSFTGGERLDNFVRSQAGQFNQAIQQRRRAFGDSQSQRLTSPPDSALAASFLQSIAGGLHMPNHSETFIAPDGFDLTETMNQGQAILLAWDEGKSLIAPLNQFTPKRSQTRTLLRVTAPIATAN